MDPFSIGALAVGGLGSLAGTAAGIWGQQQSNAANSASAQRMMDFQASQTATQHQRAVADLRAAGLNPILSATSGMSAGSASGASYQDQNPMGGVSAGVGSAVGSALQAARAKSEIANLDSSAVKNLADAGLAPHTALKIQADRKLSEAQALGTAEQTRKTRREADILGPKAKLMRGVEGAMSDVSVGSPKASPKWDMSKPWWSRYGGFD